MMWVQIRNQRSPDAFSVPRVEEEDFAVHPNHQRPCLLPFVLFYESRHSLLHRHCMVVEADGDPEVVDRLPSHPKATGADEEAEDPVVDPHHRVDLSVDLRRVVDVYHATVPVALAVVGVDAPNASLDHT
eukprot:scaffold715_cov164-Amphora_coffeaeformis.AAC.4